MGGVTHFYEEFQLHNPAQDKMGNIHLIYEVEGDKHVFPMSPDVFEQFLKMGQELLGNRVQVAHTMEEAQRVGQQAHVPQRPRR